MEKGYELKYYSIEDKFWLFVSRRDMIIRLLKGVGKSSKILEIGCSSGPLISLLQKSGFENIWGIDTSRRAIQLCKKRGIKNVFARNGAKTGFEKESFEVIIASDVLEHIKDEAKALNEWKRILKRGGKLIVFAPAFGFLWGEHDVVNQHFRRYTQKGLVRSLEKAGFRVERSSYWNFLLFFPALVLRLFQRLFISAKKMRENRDQLYGSGRVMNSLLVTIIKFENRLLETLNFPLGVSVFSIAKRR